MQLPNARRAESFDFEKPVGDDADTVLARDPPAARIARGTRNPLPPPDPRSSIESSTRVLGRVGRNLVAVECLVNDLMDLAAMDSGRLVLCREDVDLVGLVQSVCDRLEPTTPGSTMFDVRCDVMVRVDLARTERVVTNLVWSALDRAPMEAVVVRIERHGTMGRISMFVRSASPDDPRERPRHGLGLYVSRRMVEAQGGNVGVDVRGALAEVYVELPIRE